MPEINLSYVLTTFNKISFLKVILENVIRNKQDDEEIIVIDGGSNDGTPEYLKELKDSARIEYFISEKDKGEAHGFNKGFLLAKGVLIKIITDDDSFYFPAIEACKNYMLKNSDIDVLGSNTAVTYTASYKKIDILKDYPEGFMKWKEGSQQNFAFCMTPVIIRRSSLSLTGLFYINSKIPDFEWTIRVTGFANVAWYTGFPVVNIINSFSSSANSYHVFKIWPVEWGKFVHFYNWVPPKKIMRNYPMLPVSLKIWLTRFNLRNSLNSYKRNISIAIYGLFLKAGFIKKKQSIEQVAVLDFPLIYNECQQWLNNKNHESEYEFLKK